MKILRMLHILAVMIIIVAITIIGFVVLYAGFPFFKNTKFSDVLARIWTKLILLACGIRVTIEGLDNFDHNKSYIFVVNHQSLFDIPAIITKLPVKMRMLAKKELFRIPLFGWAIGLIGHIKIDRENSEKAVKSVDELIERLKNEDISPVIYPEGTRSPDGKIQKFKKGAFIIAIRSGRDIVPVTLLGARNILPKKSLLLNPGKIHIIIDKPVASSDYDFSSRAEFAEKVKKIIEDRFYSHQNI